MRGFLKFAGAAALCTAPAMAQATSPEEKAVIAAVDAFFAALRSPDKTALARIMLPDGTTIIHDRRDPENPKMRVRPAHEHLKGWEDSPPGLDEYMNYNSVLIDGDMAHVWGPYVFLVDGEPTHCGTNSMSLAKTPDGWRISNTSFTATPLSECEALGAPEVPTP